MHRLHKAAQQAQPQQKAGEGQQPGRTGGQPPRRQPGQKVDLRKGQLIAVRALLRLPDGQQKERQRGRDKMEAISIAHKTSMPSIISSGLSFFAATFGVACYSQVEMIGSICTLLARGAIISMVVVILILPAMFMIFDKIICKTSIGFLKKKTK